MLDSTPSWISAGSDDKTQAMLLSRLKRVSLYHLDVIRGGVEYLIIEAKRKNKYSLDVQSKLYLLNRYLFRLPRAVAPREFQFFGGWLLPDFGESFDPTWPFAIQKGSLVLKGIFSGYSGDEFRALAEFDYFKRHFERRKVGKA